MKIATLHGIQWSNRVRLYSFFILAVSEVTIRKVADCLNSLLFNLAFSLSSFSPLSSPPEIVDTRETVYKEASKLSYKKVCVKQGKNLWQQLSSLFNEGMATLTFSRINEKTIRTYAYPFSLAFRDADPQARIAGVFLYKEIFFFFLLF